MYSFKVQMTTFAFRLGEHEGILSKDNASIAAPFHRMLLPNTIRKSSLAAKYKNASQTTHNGQNETEAEIPNE
jgi:hypothetical protein